jgi:multidrug resistance efflux pump
MKWRWPLLVWLVAAAAAAFFYFHGGGAGGVLGYVEVVEHQLGPHEAGLLSSLGVRVGDQVSAGTSLFVMDDSLVAAELAVERSYLAEAQGVVPETLQFQSQVDRQFSSALNAAEKDLQEQILLQSRDQAELQAVTNELQRLEKLHADRLISASDLSDLRTQAAVLRQQLADYPAQIGQRTAVVDDWRRQYAQAHRDVAGAAGDRLKDENRLKNFTAEAHQNQIRFLELRRAAMELRAPTSGVISAVNRLPGEVLVAGEVVVTLIETNSDRVIGFLPEAAGTVIRVGDRVGVYRMFSARMVGWATLLAIEPAIRALPGRVSPVSTRTVRGRALVFRLEPGHDLAPGETVELHVDEPMTEFFRQWFARFRAGGR